MATPDDLTEFRNCQIGYNASAAPWNELSRGQARWVQGANESGQRLGVDAVSNRLARPADEGIYIYDSRTAGAETHARKGIEKVTCGRRAMMEEVSTWERVQRVYQEEKQSFSIRDSGTSMAQKALMRRLRILDSLMA